MKKTLKKCLALAFILALFTTCAAAASQSVAKIYPLRINVDGLPVIMLNEQQKQVPSLLYNGSNYLPIRTVGEWMGKEVAWNSDTNTVTLSGTADSRFYSMAVYNSKSDNAYVYQPGENVAVTPSTDIQILIDGVPQQFFNAQGQAVYPILYRGTTYLPLRNIGELLGMEMAWRNPTVEQMPQVSIYTTMTAEQNSACEAYLEQLTNNCKSLNEISGTLFDVAPDKELIKSVLSKMNTQLEALKNLQIPDVPYLEHATLPIMLQIDTELSDIQKAYTLVETQTIDELFSLTHGTASGILMRLSVEQNVSGSVDDLYSDYLRDGLNT